MRAPRRRRAARPHVGRAALRRFGQITMKPPLLPRGAAGADPARPRARRAPRRSRRGIPAPRQAIDDGGTREGVVLAPGAGVGAGGVAHARPGGEEKRVRQAGSRVWSSTSATARRYSRTASRLCRRRNRDAGARHRRQHRDLQHRRCGRHQTAAVSRRESARADLVGQSPRHPAKLGFASRLLRFSRRGPRRSGLRRHGRLHGTRVVHDARQRRPDPRHLLDDLRHWLACSASSRSRDGHSGGRCRGCRHARRSDQRALWQARFGRRSHLASSITVDGSAYAIVGVMPASFAFPSAAVDVWVPIPDSYRRRSRSAHFLDVVGRLAPGASAETANSVLGTIAARLETQYPDTNRGWGITTASLQDSIVGDVRRPLLVLLATVGCVLLIAWRMWRVSSWRADCREAARSRSAPPSARAGRA